MDQHLKTLLLIYFALAPALLTSQDYFYYRNKAELAFINGAEKEALNLLKAFEQSPYVACKNSLCNCFPTN